MSRCFVFAVLDPVRLKEIAAMGGKASHAKGTGHEWDKEAARVAGRKGGLASRGGYAREYRIVDRQREFAELCKIPFEHVPVEPVK